MPWHCGWGPIRNRDERPHPSGFAGHPPRKRGGRVNETICANRRTGKTQ